MFHKTQRTGIKHSSELSYLSGLEHFVRKHFARETGNIHKMFEFQKTNIVHFFLDLILVVFPLVFRSSTDET